jgi:hypothetical protein
LIGGRFLRKVKVSFLNYRVEDIFCEDFVETDSALVFIISDSMRRVIPFSSIESFQFSCDRGAES